jgi:hypothetical protein
LASKQGRASFPFSGARARHSLRSFKVEKPDPDFPFAAALDLLDPTLWRFGARQAAPKTSDIEIDWFAKRARICSSGSS